MPEARRFYIRTFGCQMNEHDSERIAGLLAADGMRHTDDIGILDARRRFHAVGREHTRDPLGIVLVHLAPVGADEVAAGHQWRRSHGASV